MVPGVSFEGTVLVDEVLPPSEVAQHIKEVMEPLKDSVGVILDHVYLVPGHPPMWSEPGFFLLHKLSFPAFLFSLEFLTP
jgi:hypothetical protein